MTNIEKTQRLNPDLKIMKLGSKNMLVEGDFKQIMILNESSKRIIELLWKEKDIELVKELWLEEINFQTVDKAVAEQDFYDFIRELQKNNFINYVNEFSEKEE